MVAESRPRRRTRRRFVEPEEKRDGEKRDGEHRAKGSEAEEDACDDASSEPLEQEITLLRARLLAAMMGDGTGLPLIMKGMEVLTKAVVARYRLSPRESQDFAENLAAVLKRFGDLIVPADR